MRAATGLLPNGELLDVASTPPMKKLVHACDFVLPVAGGARRVDSSEREVRFSAATECLPPSTTTSYISGPAFD